MAVTKTPAFFEPFEDGTFRGTEHTIGPWDVQSMHFGPPAALLGRAIERLETPVPMHVARVTVEILKPVPVSGTIRVSAEIIRPGRRVALAEATLSVDGEPVSLCRAWLMRTTDIPVPDDAREGPPTPGPDTGQVRPFFDHPLEVHYGTTMQVRFISGAFLESGPGVAWIRSPIPLVTGDPLTPLARVLLAADSGNGISAVGRPGDLVFVNTELTLHLHRYPVGEWVCLNARTTIDSDGIGVADTALSDEHGRIGRAMQSLFVDRASAP